MISHKFVIKPKQNSACYQTADTLEAARIKARTTATLGNIPENIYLVTETLVETINPKKEEQKENG